MRRPRRCDGVLKRITEGPIGVIINDSVGKGPGGTADRGRVSESGRAGDSGLRGKPDLVRGP